MKNDLIKRQDAIDALGERPAGDSDFDLGCRDQFDWDTEALRTLPSAEPERMAMVWKPAKGRPVYESGICSCGYVLTVLQRDFIYCPHCELKLVWSK